MKHVLRLATLALLPILAACHPSDGGHASSSMTLKMYEVPPAQTNELISSLSRVLNKNASVSGAGPGKLLVYAPADAQASIESAIATLREAAPPTVLPKQVELHLWVINAEAGNMPDDPALKELAPSLDALRQTIGPASFHLDQTISAASATPGQGSLTLSSPSTSQRFDFSFGPIHDSDQLYMTASYQAHGHADTDTGPQLTELNTNLDTRLGQYTILAKAPGSCPIASPSTSVPCGKSWRLLVVRVDSTNSAH